MVHCPWLPHKRAPNLPFNVVLARIRLVCFRRPTCRAWPGHGAIEIPPHDPSLRRHPWWQLPHHCAPAGHHHLSHPAPHHPTQPLIFRKTRATTEPLRCPRRARSRPQDVSGQGRGVVARSTRSRRDDTEGNMRRSGTGGTHGLQPTVRVPPGARSPRTASLIHRSILRCGSDGKPRRLKISDRSADPARSWMRCLITLRDTLSLPGGAESAGQ